MSDEELLHESEYAVIKALTKADDIGQVGVNTMTQYAIACSQLVIARHAVPAVEMTMAEPIFESKS